MALALKGEHLWAHCSSGLDPTNLADYTSSVPSPVDPTAITAAEIESVLDWLAKAAQAKSIINRRISTIVTSQLDENQTAQKLKDASDAMRYLGIFEDACQRFIQMGVTYSEDEAVFDLLQGLPKTVDWQIFCEITMSRIVNSSSVAAMTITSSVFTIPTDSSSTAIPTPSASAMGIAPTVLFSVTNFSKVAKLFIEKANSIIGKRKLSGPGSEYVHAAIGKQGSTNSSMGLCKHKHNPKGVKCTNAACEGEEWKVKHRRGLVAKQKKLQPLP
ncbi:hypothetical protein PAXRUDRAFT_15437 [Paxillus rubicundulus Ve08.2h10]|uniref:Unplaced genomic scaffold scaffold_1050, whole genome shotgun sequence n=1 Tax=Paxillus rubicundulus Ve08.2h10 TaxID=930991 RepID=A0A0D0DAS3_9AGAM|nr:hypothetical protein PAXRUDRAFT_15437 [Paxillus rubicundulus Ve08.2h10]